MSAKMVTINGNKLFNLYNGDYDRMHKTSVSAGYNEEYIQASCRKNVINGAVIKIIQSEDGIEPSEYVSDYESDEVVTSDGEFIDSDTMRGIIRRTCGTQRILGLAINRGDSFISEWLNGNCSLKAGDIKNVARVLRLRTEQINPCYKVEEPEEEPKEDNNGKSVDNFNEVIELLKEQNRIATEHNKALLEVINNQHDTIEDMHRQLEVMGKTVATIYEFMSHNNKPKAVAPVPNGLNVFTR